LKQLKVLEDSGGVKHVNVEATKPTGHKWTTDNSLVSSGLADVIATHLFNETLQLFSEERKGKAFNVLRNPIDRSASMCYFTGSKFANHELTYDPTLAEMTIEQYARSNKIENKLSRPYVVTINLQLCMGSFH